MTGLVLSLLFAVPSHQTPTQNPSRPAVSTDSTRLQLSRDSALRNERAYREILEKTNIQLSLWTNPYGLFVGALGVLFTIGTIAVGFTIFRQGSDYRNLIRQSIADYQSIINAFIEEKNQQIEILKQSVSEHIVRLAKEDEDAVGARKEQIGQEISDLRQLQDELKVVEAPRSWAATSAAALGLGQNGFGGPTPSTATLQALGRLYTQRLQHTCSKCKRQFAPSVSPLSSTKCPYCGHVDPLG